MTISLAGQLPSSSYLEEAFLHWVLTPAARIGIAVHVTAQHPITVGEHTYRLDYLIAGAQQRIAVELDGFEFHGGRAAFTYDRTRQNDLARVALTILRFSYDAIRVDTARCVAQLQAVLAIDPVLAPFIVANPAVAVPDMVPDAMWATAPPARQDSVSRTGYFDAARERLDRRPLRTCQQEALTALANYYAAGERDGACVMSVGAGKTALGVAGVLSFTRRRALVVTPGRVIRGTFNSALDYTSTGNVLYGLPGGPLIPGCRPPQVLVLDRDDGPISGVGRDRLLAADIIVTNFHSLGTGDDPDHLLAKLAPGEVDFIVIDEAHIAASASYQRLFAHFNDARTLLMSACFTRHDGKPIDADVVYRYRLIDSIIDGNAKNLRIQRFAPDATATIYEIVWPDGTHEEIIGREALLAAISDERKLARITAKSHEPIRRIMRIVRARLDEQAATLYPVKPRVLFAALGERHAEQIARLAEEHGIPCGTLHHTMSEATIKRTRDRFERDSGDLQGIVQLKMLGQGYDFPPISVVVPMRPYGSFGEFYQFVGRGIRVLTHPALIGRVTVEQQFLDIVYHAELGLDEHLETIRIENDMERLIGSAAHAFSQVSVNEKPAADEAPGSAGIDTASRPEAFVMFERGGIQERVVHDATRIEARREERELEALAQRYAIYAASTAAPATFEQFVAVIRSTRG